MNSKVGLTIKKLRQKENLTQEQLASLLNVTDKAVSKWERGLGMPDISIITQLSIILNADIDNILEGDILYLEHNWNGLLIWDNNDFLPNFFIHGKPLVYLYISYFFLAGIKNITILGKDHIVNSCRSILGDGGQFGANISYISEKEIAFNSNDPTMVVHASCFIYGPNLTKYFQRAISMHKGITVLSMQLKKGDIKEIISFDRSNTIISGKTADKYKRIPISFCHEGMLPLYNNEKLFCEENIQLNILNTVPVGNGMIYRKMTDHNSITEVSSFIKFVEESTGNIIFSLEEIAWRRGYISKEELQKLANNNIFFKDYLLGL